MTCYYDLRFTFFQHYTVLTPYCNTPYVVLSHATCYYILWHAKLCIVTCQTYSETPNVALSHAKHYFQTTKRCIVTRQTLYCHTQNVLLSHTKHCIVTRKTLYCDTPNIVLSHRKRCIVTHQTLYCAIKCVTVTPHFNIGTTPWLSC